MKVIFFDRDGTLIKDFNYNYDISKIEFTEGCIDSLIKLKNLGFYFIIVTNQSGIGRGYFTLEQYNIFHNSMLDQFKKYGIDFLDTFFCPHYLNSKIKEYSINCNCRKPKTGLFEKALLKYKIDLINSYLVGDKESDLSFSLIPFANKFILRKKTTKYNGIDNLIELYEIIKNK